MASRRGLMGKVMGWWAGAGAGTNYVRWIEGEAAN